jgi:very-short-patch-repair endonuclease
MWNADGDHHRLSRRQFNDDIRRMELLAELGWIVVRVTFQDCEADIIRRVRTAFARRIRAGSPSVNPR